MSGAFFHKGISRLQAEEFLLQSQEDGSFLVRDSETLPGAYVLCVLFQSKVHQYRILPGPDNRLHVQTEGGTLQNGYGDLTALIADYVKKGDQNGLSCGLRFPVPPERSDDDDSDEDDEQENYDTAPPPIMKKSENMEEEKIDILKNFSKLDLSRCDGEFTDALKNYVEQGFQRDAAAMNNGESELPDFRQLLEKAAVGLKKELDDFMTKLELCNQLLKLQKGPIFSPDTLKRVQGQSLSVMLEQMSRCRAEIFSLQNKAQEAVQMVAVPSEYEYLDPPQEEIHPEDLSVTTPFLSSRYMHHIPQSQFEVKQLKPHGKTTKVTLTVDIKAGKYSSMKATGKEALEQNTVSHDKILHLIKNTKDKSSLDVILDGKKKQTYSFADPRVRETFCLQIRQMKTMHSTMSDIDQISVFIGTWNMGDTSPNNSLSTWLKCSGAGKSRDRVLGVIPHDMYVIGTQESTMTEKDWVNTLKAGLKACVMVDMELVEVCTLWGIRLVVLVKPEHKKHISRIQRSSVRTGIANALGNKGAVAIAFYFHGTSMCFINAHLTSGDEKCSRRNQNYRDIIKGLGLGHKHLGLFDVTNQFHHLFWLGDLNYRVEDEIQVLLTKIQQQEFYYLLDRDQLKRAQKNKLAFCGFSEADINFKPTYRLERNTTSYNYAWRKIKKTGERINAPSWCDRVLWRSYPGVFIENVAYGCTDKIVSSDHRPVFSSFNVGITSEFVQSRSSLADATIPVKIVFHSVEAQVKTCCRQQFHLEFHSSCLSDVMQSKLNAQFVEDRTGFYTCPKWLRSEIPDLKLLFADQDFLDDQHMLVAVLSMDNESYGECVLSLKGMFGSEPQSFQYILLHQGEETGKITGSFQLVASGNTLSRKSSHKTYEFITLDTEYHDPELMHLANPRLSARPPEIKIGSTVDSEVKSRLLRQAYQTVKSEPASAHYDSIEIQDEGPPVIREAHPSVAVRSKSHIDERGPCPLPGQAPQPMPPPRNSSKGLPHTYENQDLQRSPVRTPPHPYENTSLGSRPQQPPPDQPPPPLPRKTTASKGVTLTMEQRYAEITKPISVPEWLKGLSLLHYAKIFRENGWDNLEFVIEDLTVSELLGMGITSKPHQERIMRSIQELQRRGGGS